MSATSVADFAAPGATWYPVSMIADPNGAIERLTVWAQAQPDVAAAWLFGSRARSDARPDSDFDLAILPAAERDADAGMAAIEDPLRRRLRWSIEAQHAAGLSDADLDLIDLTEAPVLLAFAVLAEGRLLVDRRPRARTAFVEATFHRAEEARHLRRIAMEARAFRHGVRS